MGMGMGMGHDAGTGAGIAMPYAGRGNVVALDSAREAQGRGGSRGAAIVPHGHADAAKKYCTVHMGACEGKRLAARLCFSCKRLSAQDPSAGFFCDPCFRLRHPWTRAGHSWAFYEQKPPAPKEVKKGPAQSNIVAAEAMHRDTKQLQTVLSEADRSTFKERREAARSCDSLMARMAEMLDTLRDDSKRL